MHGLLLCPFRGLTMKADKRWFVTRELQDSANPKLTVEVQLGFPELRDEAFRCAFRVKRLNQGKVAYAGGVDALQALINAIEGIATQLRESGRALTWMGGGSWSAATGPYLLGSRVCERDRVIHRDQDRGIHSAQEGPSVGEAGKRRER